MMTVDPDLKTVYSSVLPICTSSILNIYLRKSHGARTRPPRTVVGRYGKNGRTIEESLDQKRRAPGLRQRQQHVLPSKPVNWLVGWLRAAYACTIQYTLD